MMLLLKNPISISATFTLADDFAHLVDAHTMRSPKMLRSMLGQHK